MKWSLITHYHINRSESSHMSSRCSGPHGVMTPEVGQHAGSRTSTGWRTSRPPGGDSGVATTARRGEVGQQGGSRKDAHRGGGHRGHQGLGRLGNGGGSRRGRAARRVEDVHRVEDVADTGADRGGSWRGCGIDRGGVV